VPCVGLIRSTDGKGPAPCRNGHAIEAHFQCGQAPALLAGEQFEAALVGFANPDKHLRTLATEPLRPAGVPQRDGSGAVVLRFFLEGKNRDPVISAARQTAPIGVADSWRITTATWTFWAETLPAIELEEP